MSSTFLAELRKTRRTLPAMTLALSILVLGLVIKSAHGLGASDLTPPTAFSSPVGYAGGGTLAAQVATLFQPRSVPYWSLTLFSSLPGVVLAILAGTISTAVETRNDMSGVLFVYQAPARALGAKTLVAVAWFSAAICLSIILAVAAARLLAEDLGAPSLDSALSPSRGLLALILSVLSVFLVVFIITTSLGLVARSALAGLVGSLLLLSADLILAVRSNQFASWSITGNVWCAGNAFSSAARQAVTVQPWPNVVEADACHGHGAVLLLAYAVIVFLTASGILYVRDKT